MRKIKTAIGILMLMCALLVSEKIYVLIVYVCAASIHELGHIVAAKILRIKIKDISFDCSGLRISVDERLTSYTDEILLAAAGPASNFILAVVVAAFIEVSEREMSVIFEAAWDFINSGIPSVNGICAFFMISSGVQAVINMLPIKTFDGGRVLYCILAKVFDENISDTVISITSGIFAFVLWTVSLYLMLKISSGLGIFIFSTSVFSMILINDKVFCD